jgi:hypothetical protein
VQKRCPSFAGAVASSSGPALHQKAGKTAGSRGYEDQGACRRARRVALASESFCSNFDFRRHFCKTLSNSVVNLILCNINAFG